MYTYVQRQGCKIENTATYVHTGRVSNAFSHIRTYGRGLECLLAHTYGQGSCTWLGRNGETASSLCSWGGNGMRRVHRGATEGVLFIGRQSAWTEQPMETRPGVPQNGGNGLVFDRPHSKRDPVHREGSGGLQNGGNRLVLDLLHSKRGPVDREGCGVPQNGGNGPPTVETGGLLIGKGVV